MREKIFEICFAQHHFASSLGLIWEKLRTAKARSMSSSRALRGPSQIGIGQILRYAHQLRRNWSHSQFSTAQAVNKVFDFPTTQADIHQDSVIQIGEGCDHLSPLPAADGIVPPSQDEGHPRYLECRVVVVLPGLGLDVDGHCFLHFGKPLIPSPRTEAGPSLTSRLCSER